MSKIENIIDRAFEFAKKAHKDQEYSGLPFMYHPLQTFRILESLVPADINLLTAALLHDTLEDTTTTYNDLKQEFNKDVADLVLEVTKKGYNTFPHLKTQRGVMLKFADRLANLSNIQKFTKQKRHKYLKKSQFWQTE